MCIDNPTNHNTNADVNEFVDKEIVATVRGIWETKRFAALRTLHPGLNDLELLVLAVKTASLFNTAFYTGEKPLFYEEEFAR